jgi:purine-nucleoside phosphorylase
MKDIIQETADFLKDAGFQTPEVGIVLGTGLGKLTAEIEIEVELEYDKIPHFPTSTVEYHGGSLIFGKLEGKQVVVIHGRFHLYEGYSLLEVTLPIRVMHALGIQTLIVSNAAGAVNLDFKKGDLMLIDDHINLQGGSPLAFKGMAELGERFVDMREPYSKRLMGMLKEEAKREGIVLREGVYASVVGPQLETRAEYRMLKVLGADAVGMSSVPEVIVANQLGVETVAVSVLTDECDPDDLQPIDIPEIMEIVGKTEPVLIQLTKRLIQSL